MDTSTPINVFEAWCLIKRRNITLIISFFFRNAVSVVTKAGADRQRYRVPCRQEQEISLFSTESKPPEGPTLPLTLYEPKNLSKRGMSWKISRDVNLITPPPTAMVKNAWSYISTHREHFSFTLLFTSFSWNLGTLTSWNLLGHSRPVTGLLYLYLLFTSPLARHTIIYVASHLTRSIQYDPSRLWAYTDEQYFCIDTALVLCLQHRVILQGCLHALQTYPSITIRNCVSPLTFRIPLATHNILWAQNHDRWSSLNKDWIHRNYPKNNYNLSWPSLLLVAFQINLHRPITQGCNCYGQVFCSTPPSCI